MLKYKNLRSSNSVFLKNVDENLVDGVTFLLSINSLFNNLVELKFEKIRSNHAFEFLLTQIRSWN